MSSPPSGPKTHLAECPCSRWKLLLSQPSLCKPQLFFTWVFSRGWCFSSAVLCSRCLGTVHSLWTWVCLSSTRRPSHHLPRVSLAILASFSSEGRAVPLCLNFTMLRFQNMATALKTSWFFELTVTKEEEQGVGVETESSGLTCTHCCI